MISKTRCAVAFAGTAFLAAAQIPTAPNSDADHPQGTNFGIFAFTGNCAGCHDSGRGGAPDRYTLNRFTPEQILTSITTGSMAQYARSLSDLERKVVAVYVGGRPLGSVAAGDASAMKNSCSGSKPSGNRPGAVDWNGWGFDLGNSRFQGSPGLSAAEVPNFKLKWAFAFPNGNSAYGQPTVVAGRVFVSPAPLLRTGELRNSITFIVEGLILAVGSTDKVAAYQEQGTSHIPPRPFLRPSVIEALPLAEAKLSETAVKLFIGK